MSWSINIAGTKQGVIREVEKAVAYGDSSQLEIVKEYICSEIEAFPDTLPGVQVIASGHHDSTNRHVSIEVKPLYKLALDEPETIAAGHGTFEGTVQVTN